MPALNLLGGGGRGKGVDGGRGLRTDKNWSLIRVRNRFITTRHLEWGRAMQKAQQRSALHDRQAPRAAIWRREAGSWPRLEGWPRKAGLELDWNLAGVSALPLFPTYASRPLHAGVHSRVRIGASSRSALFSASLALWRLPSRTDDSGFSSFFSSSFAFSLPLSHSPQYCAITQPGVFLAPSLSAPLSCAPLALSPTTHTHTHTQSTARTPAPSPSRFFLSFFSAQPSAAAMEYRVPGPEQTLQPLPAVAPQSLLVSALSLASTLSCRPRVLSPARLHRSLRPLVAGTVSLTSLLLLVQLCPAVCGLRRKGMAGGRKETGHVCPFSLRVFSHPFSPSTFAKDAAAPLAPCLSATHCLQSAC